MPLAAIWQEDPDGRSLRSRSTFFRSASRSGKPGKRKPETAEPPAAVRRPGSGKPRNGSWRDGFLYLHYRTNVRFISILFYPKNKDGLAGLCRQPSRPLYFVMIRYRPSLPFVWKTGIHPRRWRSKRSRRSISKRRIPGSACQARRGSDGKGCRRRV